MASNSFIITKDDWEIMSAQQRDLLMFNTLARVNQRIDALEGKSWADKGCAFIGGVVGGFMAFMGMKIGS